MTPVLPVDSSQLSQKRSHEEVDSGDDRSDENEDDADADGEGDYTAPKSSQPKKKRAAKEPAPPPAAEKPPPKKRGRPAGTGKPRAPKVAAIPTIKARRRPRKGAAEFDAEQVAKETKIANDNPLFSKRVLETYGLILMPVDALVNPSAALQSTVEDFLESLSHTPDAAVAELINCILRTCGCNHTLDSDEVADLDNAPSKLDDVIEAMKQDEATVYPLTSKLPAFKPFRSSLQEFVSRLVSSAAELGQLYTTDLVTTLETWVVTMSSSQLRSFRHTATVVAMDILTALSDVAAAVEKEAEVLSRQKEGERKRKKGRGEPATTREKDLENKAEEVRDRRTKVKENLYQFFHE